MSLELTAAKVTLQLLIERAVQALPYLLAALAGAVYAGLVLAAAWPCFKSWAKKRAALEVPIRWKEELLSARREAAQQKAAAEQLRTRVGELEAALSTVRTCMDSLDRGTIPPIGGMGA
jgi:hypothetical protein